MEGGPDALADFLGNEDDYHHHLKNIKCFCKRRVLLCKPFFYIFGASGLGDTALPARFDGSVIIGVRRIGVACVP